MSRRNHFPSLQHGRNLCISLLLAKQTKLHHTSCPLPLKPLSIYDCTWCFRISMQSWAVSSARVSDGTWVNTLTFSGTLGPSRRVCAQASSRSPLPALCIPTLHLKTLLSNTKVGNSASNVQTWRDSTPVQQTIKWRLGPRRSCPVDTPDLVGLAVCRRSHRLPWKSEPHANS